MQATVLTIGDELLIGQVRDTNAAWLGEQLTLAGVILRRVVTVGDDEKTLQSELRQSLAESDLVVTTGGLGPTDDDKTREAVAGLFGVEMAFQENILDDIRGRFKLRGRSMPESNRSQAMVPAGFEVLSNRLGTAPGLWHETKQGEAAASMLAVLPGVPYEMKHLFTEEVLPRVRRRGGLHNIVHRTLRTAGIGESSLQETVGDLSGVLSDNLRLAWLPGPGGVRLRMTAFGRNREEADDRIAQLEACLRDRIGAYVYGANDETLEEIVGRMLRDRSLTVAVAESCTGGYVAHALTNIPGSSAYVAGGIVAYSNPAKMDLLGVSPEALRQHGAVSEVVAMQMAEGVRRRLGADLGLSTTGVAGPAGGTSEKPVGTAWIGYADTGGVAAHRLQLVRDRMLNKQLTATFLMERVRKNLLAGRP